MYKTKGFALIEVLIVVFALAALVCGGWYVWHRSHQAHSVAVQQQPGPAKAADKNYLVIKELGVKLPLNDLTRSAYYELYDTGKTDVQIADIYDADFDALKNADGISCNEKYYMLEITRAQTTIVPQLQDPSSPRYNGPAIHEYKAFPFTDKYRFDGFSMHFDGASCAVLKPNAKGDIATDARIEHIIADKKAAYEQAFTSLQAL